MVRVGMSGRLSRLCCGLLRIRLFLGKLRFAEGTHQLVFFRFIYQVCARRQDILRYALGSWGFTLSIWPSRSARTHSQNSSSKLGYAWEAPVESSTV